MNKLLTLKRNNQTTPNKQTANNQQQKKNYIYINTYIKFVSKSKLNHIHKQPKTLQHFKFQA